MQVEIAIALGVVISVAKKLEHWIFKMPRAKNRHFQHGQFEDEIGVETDHLAGMV